MLAGYLDRRSLCQQAIPKAKVEVGSARLDLQDARAQVVDLIPQGGDHRPGPSAALLSAHPGKRLVVRFHHLFRSHEAVLGREDEPALAGLAGPAPAPDKEGAGVQLPGRGRAAQPRLDATDEPDPFPEGCRVPNDPIDDAPPQPRLAALPMRVTAPARAGTTSRRD